MNGEERGRVLSALLRRAVGYRTEESVDEYAAGEGGEAVFVRRRVTDKDVPGDVSAARLLLELDGAGTSGELGALSDEELFRLRQQLLDELKALLPPQ